MRRDDQQVRGEGEYVFDINRHNFFNAWVREAQLHTYHRMFLAVL